MGWYQEREKQEFSHWIDDVFKRSWKITRIKNLIEDLSSGVLLLNLTEVLVCEKLPLIHRYPKTFTQKLENVELSLEALRNDGVTMPGILAQDVAGGDEEVILTLCCFLRRHYTSEPNFIGTQKSDDEYFIAEDTLESEEMIRNGSRALSPCPGQSDLPFREQDARRTTNVACQELRFIPFEKEDVAILEWVSRLTGRFIENYDAFADGGVLCDLINCISLRMIPKKVIERSSPADRIKLALDAGTYELGIKTELTAQDLTAGKQQHALRDYLYLLREIYLQQIDSIHRNSEYESFLDSESGSLQFLEGSFAAMLASDMSRFNQSEMIDDDLDRQLGYHQSKRVIKDTPLGRGIGCPSTEDQSCWADKLVDRSSFLSGSSTLLSMSETTEIEKRRKREILQQQLKQMQFAVAELKSKLKSARISNRETFIVDDIRNTSKHNSRGNNKSIPSPRDFVIKDPSVRTVSKFAASSKGKSNITGNFVQPEVFTRTNTSSGQAGRILNKFRPSQNHEDADYVNDNEEIKTDASRRDSSTSSKSTCSSLSQVAHDVTRLVRLSSRKPKGSDE